MQGHLSRQQIMRILIILHSNVRIGMSLGRGPARPGLARALQKVIFGLWPTVGQADSFWPKFGPGRKKMAQTQLIGMSSGFGPAWPGLARALQKVIFGVWPAMGRAGLGLAQVRPGPEKNGPNSSLVDSALYFENRTPKTPQKEKSEKLCLFLK